MYDAPLPPTPTSAPSSPNAVGEDHEYIVTEDPQIEEDQTSNGGYLDMNQAQTTCKSFHDRRCESIATARIYKTERELGFLYGILHNYSSSLAPTFWH